MKNIALLGDPSSHGGVLISTNTDDTFTTNGIPVCGNGCLHACPIPFHGVTSVTAVTIKSFINGILVITYGAVAGCGAIIQPPYRGVTVE